MLAGGMTRIVQQHELFLLTCDKISPNISHAPSHDSGSPATASILSFSAWAMYEHLHAVSPGNGVLQVAHRLRLIPFDSVPLNTTGRHRGSSSSLGAGSGAGGSVHGRWEEGRTSVATEVTVDSVF